MADEDASALRAEFERRPEAAREAGSEITEDQARLMRQMYLWFSDPSVREGAERVRARAAEMSSEFAQYIQPIVDGLRRIGQQLALVVAVFEQKLPPLLERMYFPNWQWVHVPQDDALIEKILLDEGIPLAWIPPRETPQLLLGAESMQATRTILSRRWRSLVAHCEAEIGSVSAPNLSEARRFSLAAASELRDGHTAPSQALSANLLDTLLREKYDKKARGSLTGCHKSRLGIGELAFQEAILLGGIFGGHKQVDGEAGALPPRVLSRHGSVHALSRRQNSRVNAMIAVMHVTSLLKLLDSERKREPSRFHV